MIRYSITKQELDSRIQTANATWLTRAQARTAEIRNGTRTRITNIWSDIKSVFMDLQGPKCAYCEKWIEDNQAIEFDVEHFRPKNRISRWRLPASLQQAGVILTQPATGTEPGYRLLSYNHLNYLAACKTCNSKFKKDRFPISGPRDSGNDDPTQMSGEQPYLIYPISDIDDDPETLIEFRGLSPRPKQTGFGRQRALVTIAFFGLDDATQREGLLKARAQRIELAFFALRERDRAVTIADRDLAIAAIERLKRDRSPHANAVRCFVRLWESDRTEAESEYQQIASWLAQVSP